jgi:hypothetical protein
LYHFTLAETGCEAGSSNCGSAACFRFSEALVGSIVSSFSTTCCCGFWTVLRRSKTNLVIVLRMNPPGHPTLAAQKAHVNQRARAKVPRGTRRADIEKPVTPSKWLAISCKAYILWPIWGAKS